MGKRALPAAPRRDRRCEGLDEAVHGSEAPRRVHAAEGGLGTARKLGPRAGERIEFVVFDFEERRIVLRFGEIVKAEDLRHAVPHDMPVDSGGTALWIGHSLARPHKSHRNARAASSSGVSGPTVAKIPPGSGQSRAARASPVAATGMARSKIDNVLPVAKSSTGTTPSRARERMRRSRKLACWRASNAARSSPVEGLRRRSSRSTAVLPLREGANVASSKASIRACAIVSALSWSSGSRFARASH